MAGVPEAAGDYPRPIGEIQESLSAKTRDRLLTLADCQSAIQEATAAALLRDLGTLGVDITEVTEEPLAPREIEEDGV